MEDRALQEQEKRERLARFAHIRRLRDETPLGEVISLPQQPIPEPGSNDADAGELTEAQEELVAWQEKVQRALETHITELTKHLEEEYTAFIEKKYKDILENVKDKKEIKEILNQKQAELDAIQNRINTIEPLFREGAELFAWNIHQRGGSNLAIEDILEVYHEDFWRQYNAYHTELGSEGAAVWAMQVHRYPMSGITGMFLHTAVDAYLYATEDNYDPDSNDRSRVRGQVVSILMSATPESEIFTHLQQYRTRVLAGPDPIIDDFDYSGGEEGTPAEPESASEPELMPELEPAPEGVSEPETAPVITPPPTHPTEIPEVHAPEAIDEPLVPPAPKEEATREIPQPATATINPAAAPAEKPKADHKPEKPHETHIHVDGVGGGVVVERVVERAPKETSKPGPQAAESTPQVPEKPKFTKEEVAEARKNLSEILDDKTSFIEPLIEKFWGEVRKYEKSGMLEVLEGNKELSRRAQKLNDEYLADAFLDKVPLEKLADEYERRGEKLVSLKALFEEETQVPNDVVRRAAQNAYNLSSQEGKHGKPYRRYKKLGLMEFVNPAKPAPKPARPGKKAEAKPAPETKEAEEIREAVLPPKDVVAEEEIVHPPIQTEGSYPLPVVQESVPAQTPAPLDGEIIPPSKGQMVPYKQNQVTRHETATKRAIREAAADQVYEALANKTRDFWGVEYGGMQLLKKADALIRKHQAEGTLDSSVTNRKELRNAARHIVYEAYTKKSGSPIRRLENFILVRDYAARIGLVNKEAENRHIFESARTDFYDMLHFSGKNGPRNAEVFRQQLVSAGIFAGEEDASHIPVTDQTQKPKQITRQSYPQLPKRQQVPQLEHKPVETVPNVIEGEFEVVEDGQ